MQTKQLGVIILNWNGLELLKQFIPAAIKYTVSPEADLIVADNGSTDGSVDWLAANHPEVKIIRLNQNHGFAKGYNIAIAEAAYPYTVLLNSDVEVTPDWWQPLIAFLQSHPDCGAVQPKILSWHAHQNGEERFEYAGAAGGYLDRLGYPYCRGRLFDQTETDCGQYDGEPTRICWASGACLAVRTADYLRAGGLDPDFFAHMEEIDLCCRMQALGMTVYAVPQSKVYHVGGASLNQGNPQKTYLNFRNNLLLLHKNLTPRRGRRTLFFRRLADTLAWAMYIAKRDFPNARAIIKAHRDFRKMRSKYTDSPTADILPQLPGSKRWAVWDRYVRRQTK